MGHRGAQARLPQVPGLDVVGRVELIPVREGIGIAGGGDVLLRKGNGQPAQPEDKSMHPAEFLAGRRLIVLGGVGDEEIVEAGIVGVRHGGSG